jgi:hypothetical protein
MANMRTLTPPRLQSVYAAKSETSDFFRLAAYDSSIGAAGLSRTLMAV